LSSGKYGSTVEKVYLKRGEKNCRWAGVDHCRSTRHDGGKLYAKKTTRKGKKISKKVIVEQPEKGSKAVAEGHFWVRLKHNKERKLGKVN